MADDPDPESSGEGGSLGTRAPRRRGRAHFHQAVDGRSISRMRTIPSPSRTPASVLVGFPAIAYVTRSRRSCADSHRIPRGGSRATDSRPNVARLAASSARAWVAGRTSLGCRYPVILFSRTLTCGSCAPESHVYSRGVSASPPGCCGAVTGLGWLVSPTPGAPVSSRSTRRAPLRQRDRAAGTGHYAARFESGSS